MFAKQPFPEMGPSWPKGLHVKKIYQACAVLPVISQNGGSTRRCSLLVSHRNHIAQDTFLVWTVFPSKLGNAVGVLRCRVQRMLHEMARAALTHKTSARPSPLCTEV